MNRTLLLSAAFVAFTAQNAAAAITVAEVADTMIAAGYEAVQVRMKEGVISAKGRTGGSVLHVSYDAETGEVLRYNTNAYIAPTDDMIEDPDRLDDDAFDEGDEAHEGDEADKAAEIDSDHDGPAMKPKKDKKDKKKKKDKKGKRGNKGKS